MNTNPLRRAGSSAPGTFIRTLVALAAWAALAVPAHAADQLVMSTGSPPETWELYRTIDAAGKASCYLLKKDTPARISGEYLLIPFPPEAALVWVSGPRVPVASQMDLRTPNAFYVSDHAIKFYLANIEGGEMRFQLADAKNRDLGSLVSVADTPILRQALAKAGDNCPGQAFRIPRY